MRKQKRTYYTARRAASYNRDWKTFSERTLAATCSAIELAQLPADRPRILDVACGTGLLLQRLAQLIPDAELFGVDASQEMLAQAHLLLGHHPRIHLTLASLKSGETAGLPYAPGSFDLITCTNALHYLDDPASILQGLAALLGQGGQFVIEDYARRTFPFPWRIFEWFIRRVDPQHIRAYTLTEARLLCQRAGLEVLAANAFGIDALWQGWVMRTQRRSR